MSITDPLSEKDPVKLVGYTNFISQVRAGHISVSWMGWREVYLCYQKNKSKFQGGAMARTAEELSKPINSVYDIVKRFE